MTKPFCDVCGDPALDMKQIKLETGMTTNIGVAIAVARVNLGFEKHPAGYGGPPDLCRRHLKFLLESLLTCLPPEDQK